MPNSREVRRLTSKWLTNNGWPKRLEWIEIEGLRGWDGQRFSLNYPIMAVTGENGVGKSTVLQAAASVYRPQSGGRERFASDFFPDTPWDSVSDVVIRFAVKEGDRQTSSTVRKPTGRWRGNPERPQRAVEYIDLSRVQPVPARVGYTRLANPAYSEASAASFEESRLGRFSRIMGRQYDLARMAITDADQKRAVPVLTPTRRRILGLSPGSR